jgi:tetratricopeptide (TPR) repeat protein
MLIIKKEIILKTIFLNFKDLKMKKLILTIFIFLFFVSSVSSQSWRVLDSISIEYKKKGDYEKGIKYGEKAFKQAEKEFGKKHQNYATSSNNLGILYYNMGQYEKAESLYLKALKIYKEVIGEKHPDYAGTLINMADLYEDIDNFEKAELYYKEANKIFKEVLGERNRDYATSLNNLGLLYCNMGQFEKAEPLYNESLKINKEVLGEKDPDYVVSLSNLASLYFKKGNYDKAESFFLEVLKIEKEIYGEKHINYATDLGNLAVLYDVIGNHEKAEQMYLEVIKITKEVLGEKHPDYATDLKNLAVLYYNTKQYEKAETLSIKALNLNKEILGEKHQDYATSLNILAGIYRAMGDYEKSESYFLKALEIRKETRGEKHPSYANSLINLGVLYDKMEQFDKAEPFYLEGIKIYKEVLGEKHPNYAQTLYNLGGIYKNTGQYDKAEPLFTEANSIYLDQLNINFSVLSESEKMKFLKTIEKKFEIFNSFSLSRYPQNPSISSDMLNVRLLTKGIVLSSGTRTKNIIHKSGSRELSEIFDKLTILKIQLSKAYSLSIKERNKKGIDIPKLENDANDLEKELSRKSDLYRVILEEKEIKWTDVKSNLSQNEAAIEFIDFRNYDKYWTDTTYYCAIIIRPDFDYPELVKLFSLDEIRDILSKPADNNKGYAKNEDVSNSLYRIIWRPIEKYLAGVEKIYISPSGVLNKVSFNALATDDNQYLINKFDISYIGNLKDIVANRREIPGNVNNLLTASVFGGAIFDEDTTEMIEESKRYLKSIKEEAYSSNNEYSTGLRNETDISRGYNWNYLPGTKQEAEKIKLLLEKSNYNVSCYTGISASEEAFKSLGKSISPAIIHISTHGFFFPEPEKDYNTRQGEGRDIFKLSDNPLFRSGLILSGANFFWSTDKRFEGIEDGILTAYDVSNMDLSNTELVVLSACETGLGDIKGGEGVFGLQRAFKVAGAKTIIMSLWKVPDKETVELMELFYTNWLGGMTKHGAFNKAQKEMRKKYEPYYWAAFVMVE